MPSYGLILQGVPDLDDDGRQELVVVLSGGDASIGRVYVADRTSEPKLTLVQAVDADGQKAELSTDASVGADAWQVTYLPEGIYSLRANSAEPGAPPYDVQVRRWVLSGTTLTESSEQTVGCWESQGESFGLWLGRC